MSKYLIKSLRVRNGYKAGEFAEMIGISREYLRLIENNQAKNPSREIMKRISELLNADVKELFFED